MRHCPRIRTRNVANNGIAGPGKAIPCLAPQSKGVPVSGVKAYAIYCIRDGRVSILVVEDGLADQTSVCVVFDRACFVPLRRFVFQYTVVWVRRWKWWTRHSGHAFAPWFPVTHGYIALIGRVAIEVRASEFIRCHRGSYRWRSLGETLSHSRECALLALSAGWEITHRWRIIICRDRYLPRRFRTARYIVVRRTRRVTRLRASVWAWSAILHWVIRYHCDLSKYLC